MRGIVTAGGYLPRFRLSTDKIEAAWDTAHAAGINQKTVPAADEDALTMAVAAAEQTLAASQRDPATIDLIVAATTTPPLDEGEFVPRLVRALGLPETVTSTTIGQHTAAGAEAFARALDADGTALVVTTDCPKGKPAATDHPLGAAAAAFLIDHDPTVPIHEIAWYTDDAPGIRYRQRGDQTVRSLDITTYERNIIRTGITKAVGALEVDTSSATGAAMHQRNGTFPYRAAADLPLSNEAVARGTVADEIGDAGAATVPVGLLSALAEAADDDLTIGAFFGGGSAAAVAFEGGLSVAGIDTAEQDGIDYLSYLRKRGYVGDGTVSGGGAHVSLPTWRRSLDQRYRLIAGRCSACDGVTFPPDGACQQCHARTDFETFEAPRTGTVQAVTVIRQDGAPPEFAELQQRTGAYAVAIIALETEHGTVTLPAQLTDTDPNAVTVGTTVRATLRRIYDQQDVPRYGIKFKPVE
ncbi:zinc ribbon domain-containing protein [Halobacterium sp. KA-6]|uniref:zinc ribbon domain-containing protein n=1 Tax=Halobacterium sp. KA-6 TaxID=2896368 RepID=UPI001E46456B|nr:zinc ribbon domain-containing protein [Halobacterium sp. KA-6]MCD2204037.1 zinc ribbon domain-containing protein [Halobacterium sp. KA-6]